MSGETPKLFIEINNSEFIFAAGTENKEKSIKFIFKVITPLQGIKNYRITDLGLVCEAIKKGVYTVEQKLNLIFKDTILIINNFNCSYINLSGYRKLNGSQISKENITYILNSLKSNVIKFEEKKTILHIFNSKFNLDKKEIDNLPIGLFGDFYAHELSFNLINDNDFNNLNNIFDKCNLKIKNFFLKSFVEGSLISKEYNNLGTFFNIKINKKDSNIFYFENDSLKFEQNFISGSDLIINDISKITSLKTDTVKKIIKNITFEISMSNENLIEKKQFDDENFIKIKKRLIFQIVEARVKELLEIIILKNINLTSYKKKHSVFFFTFADKSHFKSFKNIYETIIEKNQNLEARFVKNISTEDLINNANKLVHFGWKKEAIPVVQIKKSVIARFFEALFS